MDPMLPLPIDPSEGLHKLFRGFGKTFPLEWQASSGNDEPSPKKKPPKQKKKVSRNDRRQKRSQTAANDGIAKRQPIEQPDSEAHKLKSSAEFPDIIIEKPDAALDFEETVSKLGTHWVLYVDGSTKPATKTAPLRPASASSFESPSPSSRGSSPSRPGSPPSETTIQCSGASVIYEDKTEIARWKEIGVSLPGVESSLEAELYGIDQGLKLILDEKLKGTAFEKKVVILTDCQEALKTLKKQLMAEMKNPSKAAEAAASKAVELRHLKVPLELRYVPGHMGVHGNQVADRYAKQASEYCLKLKASDIGKIVPWHRPVPRRRKPQPTDCSPERSSSAKPD
ncbi:hypothetical protein BJY01DRAFT_143373 [Aspergillus pseudoustus]|uniref:ribonuclease H n=1 Tax=Aspergillus pseudoustus TaxID=1810923 RepID=A0ABR4KAY7_9EURO